MAKTYQLSHKGKFGASLKVVPVTTETETNTLKCLEVNGTDTFYISPQSALPDLTDFKVSFIYPVSELNLCWKTIRPVSQLLVLF